MQGIIETIKAVETDKAKRYGTLLDARGRHLSIEEFDKILYARADDFVAEGKYRTNRRPVNFTKKEWAAVDADNASDAAFMSRIDGARSKGGAIELSPIESDWVYYLRTGEALGDVAEYMEEGECLQK